MLKKIISSKTNRFKSWLKAYERSVEVRREARRIEEELSLASDADLTDLGLNRWDIPEIARKTAEQHLMAA